LTTTGSFCDLLFNSCKSTMNSFWLKRITISTKDACVSLPQIQNCNW
jgi:hypothetical protein